MPIFVFYLLLQFLIPLLCFLIFLFWCKHRKQLFVGFFCLFGVTPFFLCFYPQVGYNIFKIISNIFEGYQIYKNAKKDHPEINRIFEEIKNEAGTIIYKPFEQWVMENPGVIETLEKTENRQLIRNQHNLQKKYPNLFIVYQGIQCKLTFELCVKGRQRIGWYIGYVDYMNGQIGKSINILYDIEKKEVLATQIKISIKYNKFPSPEFGPIWYKGSTNIPHVSFGKYADNFFYYNTKE